MTDLDQLVDAFLEEEFELSPVTASALGLTAYDAGMDDLSADSFAERDRDTPGLPGAVLGACGRRT